MAAQPAHDLPDNGEVPPIELHHRIRAALEYRSIEPEDLAVALDKHINTVHNYIAGRTVPGRSVILHIAMVCRVSRKWLETGKTEDDGDAPFPPEAVTSKGRKNSRSTGREQVKPASRCIHEALKAA